MSIENPNLNQEKEKPVRFKTSRGSVYEYLPDGRVQRFKTATQEQLEPQDAIVFIPPWDMVKGGAKKNYPEVFEFIDDEGLYESLLLEHVHSPDFTMRIVDGSGNELLSNAEIQSADRVYVSCINRKEPKKSFYLPVSKDPKIGYQTYDTTKYIAEDGKTYRNKHLGNKVVEIE